MSSTQSPTLSLLGSAALLGTAALLAVLTGCPGADTTVDTTGTGTGSGTDPDPMTPTVIASSPEADAVLVRLDAAIAATFSEAMNGDSLTEATFTLASGDPLVSVAGAVTYVDAVASFLPDYDLASGTSFYATLTTGAAK